MKAYAINLSNNILIRAFQERISVTPMKLQRLLYYICRDYARETGHSPVNEDFQIWQYGPVLQSVHWKFSCFRKRPITCLAGDATGQCRLVNETANPVLTRIIDSVWAGYKNLNGIALSELSRTQGSAWLKAFESGRETITDFDLIADVSGYPARTAIGA